MLNDAGHIWSIFGLYSERSLEAFSADTRSPGVKTISLIFSFQYSACYSLDVHVKCLFGTATYTRENHQAAKNERIA